MSLPTETQAQWASIILSNKQVVEAVINEALKTMPEYPAVLDDQTKIATVAMQRKGYEEALQNVFSKIPGDRAVTTASKFMDMT